ncbi:hypothetical protein ABFS83_10G119300 [Erythranthe nasuta]
MLPFLHAMTHHHNFVVAETPNNRLCSDKSILTVNGQFPGPTIYPRYPWSDGPEYITQCPIRPGSTFRQKIVLSDEVGTLWWHAHSDWSRATPFDYGKTYLLRMVNDVMNNIMFVRINNHNITIVGTDGACTKPFTTNYIAISPGQTIDFLLEANQNPNRNYYMAARVYTAAGSFDNTTTTAIIEYNENINRTAPLTIPSFPDFNDTRAFANFTGRLISLADKKPPDQRDRLLASINNITFQQPRIAILEAYYNMIRGVYGNDFPSRPPLTFNYTADVIPRDLWVPENGTDVRPKPLNKPLSVKIHHELEYFIFKQMDLWTNKSIFSNRKQTKNYSNIILSEAERAIQ